MPLQHSCIVSLRRPQGAQWLLFPFVTPAKCVKCGQHKYVPTLYAISRIARHWCSKILWSNRGSLACIANRVRTHVVEDVLPAAFFEFAALIGMGARVFDAICERCIQRLERSSAVVPASESGG